MSEYSGILKLCYFPLILFLIFNSSEFGPKDSAQFQMLWLWSSVENEEEGPGAWLSLVCLSVLAKVCLSVLYKQSNMHSQSCQEPFTKLPVLFNFNNNKMKQQHIFWNIGNNTFHFALAKFFSICAQTPSLMFLSEAAFPEILRNSNKRMINGTEKKKNGNELHHSYHSWAIASCAVSRWSWSTSIKDATSVLAANRTAENLSLH